MRECCEHQMLHRLLRRIENLSSSFPISIFHVFGVSPNPQMRRADARWVIAGMTDIKTFWNRAILENPRLTMSHIIFSSDSKNPISSQTMACSPNPTSRSFFDIFPKAFFWSDNSFFMGTFKTPNAYCANLLSAIFAFSSIVRQSVCFHPHWGIIQC